MNNLITFLHWKKFLIFIFFAVLCLNVLLLMGLHLRLYVSLQQRQSVCPRLHYLSVTADARADPPAPSALLWFSSSFHSSGHRSTRCSCEGTPLDGANSALILTLAWPPTSCLLYHLRCCWHVALVPYPPPPPTKALFPHFRLTRTSPACVRKVVKQLLLWNSVIVALYNWYDAF